ncbi:MAG: glutathione peroxidase [Gammaproteobacteria bacterium]|tara:strand:+ start:185 stop:664 length:480 start_codon:yes stop_codon:yes gene_type:complete
MKTIYSFSVKDADLNEVSLKTFQNKVLLIVNVASFCGLTYQYKGLENIYKKYANKGLEILGFPCNQFAFQEPGTNEEIKDFCESNYGVTFRIMNKINVNGSNADPFYNFLKEQKPGVIETPQIKWNFTKFLINRDGYVVERFSPQAEIEEIEIKILDLI